MNKDLQMLPGLQAIQHRQAVLRAASNGALSGATFPFFTGKQ